MEEQLQSVAPSENVVPSVRRISLTPQQVKAARMLAESNLTRQQIADRLKINPRTLLRWAGDPEYEGFQRCFAKYLDRCRRAALAGGLAERWKRVESLSDKHARYERFIEERAAEPEMQGIPGGTTGLVARRLKVIGGGDSAREVVEYEADTGLTTEMRLIQEQIARECGHREREGASAIRATVDGDKLSVEVVYIGGTETK